MKNKINRLVNEVLEQAIDSVINEGDVVLDPFIGSGTTALACIKTNRKYIGIDLNDEYVELSKQRIIKLNESN